MKTLSNLSAIIIAKNEEKRIAACIQNLSFTSEIIVVDNGSTDRTVAIAEQNGARVVPSSSHDFSVVRTRGMKEAGSEWILYLDADEEVTENLREEIFAIIGQKAENNKQSEIGQKAISNKQKTQSVSCLLFTDQNKYHAFFIPRRNIFLGRVWPTPDKQVRLFIRKYLKGWKGHVHESALVDGPVGELTSYMNHYTHRTLTEMVEKTNEWSTIEAQLRFDAHHPAMSWWRMFRVMMTSFWDYFIKQKGYTIGMAGLVESIYQSFSTFVTYAKLWEMQIAGGSKQ